MKKYLREHCWITTKLGTIKTSSEHHRRIIFNILEKFGPFYFLLLLMLKNFGPFTSYSGKHEDEVTPVAVGADTWS